MKSLDIRSESAVKLLAEFLDIDAEYDAENPRANAEHFAHGQNTFSPLTKKKLTHFFQSFTAICGLRSEIFPSMIQ